MKHKYFNLSNNNSHKHNNKFNKLQLIHKLLLHLLQIILMQFKNLKSLSFQLQQQINQLKLAYNNNNNNHHRNSLNLLRQLHL